MTDPINGRELLAINARTSRAAQGQHQSLRQTEKDREALVREVYRLRKRDAVASAAWVFVDEMRGYCSPHGVAVWYADRLEELLRRAEGNAPGFSPASAPTEAAGGVNEPEEARE